MSLVVKEKIPTFDHVLHQVFLGDREAAESHSIVTTHRIAVIVNLSNTRYVEYEGIQYYHFDVEDDKHVDIAAYFASFEAILRRHSEQPILIHCINSVSRSVTFALYYLMTMMNLKEAFMLLTSKRTQYTKPNIGFIKQLLAFERSKYGQNSMTIQDFYRCNA